MHKIRATGMMQGISLNVFPLVLTDDSAHGEYA